MQEEEGLDSVEVDDLQEFLPGAEETGIAYALFEPDSGFADPVATTRAYIDGVCGARAHGRSRARRSRRSRSRTARVRGVRVGGELVECDSVVLAAGPWSLALARGIGLELPLEITREQDVVFDDGAGADDPVRGLVAGRPRLHAPRARARRAAHLLVGRGFPKDVRAGRSGRATTTAVDAAFEADVREPRRHRLPRARRDAAPSAGASACTT